MHIMYIDESGDTQPLEQRGSQFFVLTGCIIDEKDITIMQRSFSKIKKKYFGTADMEIKSNFLRYANPCIKGNSPIKLSSFEVYSNLEHEVADYLKHLPVTLLSVGVHKSSYWFKTPNASPYLQSYKLLFRMFQRYLSQNNCLGICIIDPREGRVEKHYFGNEIGKLHELMRQSVNTSGGKQPHVIERLLFSESDKTVGIQVVDLLCYPIFHVLEYDKSAGEYWRFEETVANKLRVSNLKIVPSQTKKNLKLFT